jgi:hypothetical protein
MEVGTMTAQTSVAAGASSAPGTPAQAMPERTARYLPGIPMLVPGLVLLVVLCSEQATQQVVNTGSLYQ